jgi:hypothetical protein
MTKNQSGCHSGLEKMRGAKKRLHALQRKTFFTAADAEGAEEKRHGDWATLVICHAGFLPSRRISQSANSFLHYVVFVLCRDALWFDAQPK